MAHAITNESWDDPLMAAIRPAVRDAIEAALDAELRAVLGAARYERVAQRVGDRNGRHQRELGTPMGAIAVTVPRARVGAGDRRRFSAFT